MSTTVLKLPTRPRRRPPAHRVPRRRVFYLGYRLVGPRFCQDIQRVYLKRHRNNKWSFLHYEAGFSFEFEWFHGPELPERLSRLGLEGEVSHAQLEETGWRGAFGPNVIQLRDYQ